MDQLLTTASRLAWAWVLVVLAALAVTSATAGTAQAGTASTASAPPGRAIVQIAQRAGSVARGVATPGARPGTALVTFSRRAPIVVPTTVDALPAAVRARAEAMVRPYVKDRSWPVAVKVVKGACLFDFASDVYGEKDAVAQVRKTAAEFGGNQAFVDRAILLGEDMRAAPDDAMQEAAKFAACEAAEFFPVR